jgi:ABC-2 type transport system permease protein
MRALSAIVKREFLSYFFSPLAYVVLAGFLFVNSLTFRGVLFALANADVPSTALISLLFTNVFFWIFMIIVPSVIAMRLIAEERKSGSIESLLTAPVGEGTVVVAKFLGGWLFFLFLWLPTVAYPLMISSKGRVDAGPVAAGYLGIALIGALFIAAGTFASALTKNQIVAAILGFVFVLVIFLAGVFKDYANETATREALTYLNLLEHMDDFSRGIVDTRRLVYVVSSIAFFLFLGTRALETNKAK